MNSKIEVLGDEDILKDMLVSQKYITQLYNTNVNECVDKELTDNMLKILREEHNIQSSIFEDLQKRGLYPTVDAEQQLIDEANTDFQNKAQQL